MSKTRQAPLFLALSQNFPRGGILSGLHHAQDQLLYVETGVATVKNDRGLWAVVPGRALFLADRAPYALKLGPRSRLHGVFFRSGSCTGATTGVRVSNFLRELVLAACRADQEAGVERALELLVRTEIERERFDPLFVPEPVSEALAAFCVPYARAMGRAQKKPPTRTIERLFRSELGLSFRGWRIRVTLARALELLGQNYSVAEVAGKLGYSSASAFIYAFRRELGCTPGEYFRVRSS